MLCYDDTEETAIAPLLCSVLSCTFHLQCRQLRIVVGYSKQRSSLHGHVVCCVVVVAVYCGRRVLWSPCIMVAVYYGRRVLQFVADTHTWMCHPSIHPSIRYNRTNTAMEELLGVTQTAMYAGEGTYFNTTVFWTRQDLPYVPMLVRKNEKRPSFLSSISI
jgi:hypothetical protein